MRLSNILTDDMLKNATREVQLREIVTLRQEIEFSKKYIFSESYNQKMLKLLHRCQKPYFKFINTIGKRAAIIIIVTFISFSATAMSVEAIRVPIIRFFIEIFE